MDNPKWYFTTETQNAIIEFNVTCDEKRKNFLFDTYIQGPFLKLTEYLINNYRFYFPGTTVKDTQSKIIAFLIEQLKKYKPEKGKAYSYFTRVAFNQLIYISKEYYTYIKIHRDINELDFLFEEKDLIPVEEKIEFFDKFLDYLEDHLPIFFDKELDIKIALTIIDMLKSREKIMILNKKAIYLSVKEIIPNLPPLAITMVVHKFKIIYKNVFSNFLEKEKLFYSGPSLISEGIKNARTEPSSVCG
jgi:hypothetical protein